MTTAPQRPSDFGNSRASPQKHELFEIAEDRCLPLKPHCGGYYYRPLKKAGLMENGKWEMAKCSGFSIFHLPSAIQDAFSASCQSKRPPASVIVTVHQAG
jgi:hypothetical protein